MNNQFKIRKLVVAALLCALAYLVVVVFPIRVQFLTFDAKDAIIAIGSLLLGPLYGLGMAIVVPLLEMLTISATGFYGFIMNFLSSATFACVCGLIYSIRRDVTGAIVGLALSVASMTAVMMAANLFITPLYMGVERTVVVQLIPTLLLPFNLTKAALNAGITLLLYKPFTAAVRATDLLPAANGGGSGAYHFGVRSVLLTSVALAVIAAAVAVFFVVLQGRVG